MKTNGFHLIYEIDYGRRVEVSEKVHISTEREEKRQLKPFSISSLF